MRVLLRAKLVASFIAVIAVTGFIATAIGVYLVGSGIVREAQNKVALDLNSARQFYDEKLGRVREALEFTAMRRFGVREALAEGNRRMLLESLGSAMEKGALDFLSVTDREGRVVLRARAPGNFGDDQAGDVFVREVLARGKTVLGTEIVPREELALESRDLAEQARIALVETPHAKPASETESTSGMMMKAAVPVTSEENGSVLGVLYGGVLLNRNFEIVDRTKDVVYRGAKHEGKDMGTATIFQGDLRISTNVMSRDGKRAIGTRLSAEVADRVLGEGRIWTDRAFVVNDWYLTAYEPIRGTDGRVLGVLYVGMLEKKYADMRRETFWLLAGVTVAGMVLALGIAYVLANAVARPVQRLKRGVEALARGDFDTEVSVDSADEIGDLARSFNSVRGELKGTYAKLHGKIEAAGAELREKQKQLMHAEKLASVGALAAGVAHEINNPLGTIKLYAQMTLDDAPEAQGDLRENMCVILKHATRAGDIVRNLLEFARRTELETKPVDVNSVLDEVLRMTAHHAELQNVEVTRDLAEGLPLITGDADKLRQVFVNIVVNALQAMPGGGRLACASAPADGASGVRVRIADTGSGILPEHLGKIFDPFFTTKGTGKGTGLGLSVSHGIIEQHGGAIAVESVPGKGTAFTVTIPAAQGAPPSGRSDLRSSPASPAGL